MAANGKQRKLAAAWRWHHGGGIGNGRNGGSIMQWAGVMDLYRRRMTHLGIRPCEKMIDHGGRAQIMRRCYWRQCVHAYLL